MYKSTSDFSQRRSSQLWLADLQSEGFLALSKEEQRENLCLRLRQIEAQIHRTPFGSGRLELTTAAQQISREITRIRPKKKYARGLPNYFMDVAKERMTKPAYEAFLKEAIRRSEAIETKDSVR